jgi:prepilin-type N-terminal cleavage/methylation domain-containing protein
MPISSAGKTIKSESGVTLLEMMIVVTLIALLAGITFPSVASGLDSLRLRSASDSILAFLNTAVDRAERRQQAVEVTISQKDNALTARSADGQFVRQLALPPTVKMVNPAGTRDFLLYPGGTVPAIKIELSTGNGHNRTVAIDPITGVPLAEPGK